jgi:ubiquinone/menaquinone biosynthesis C-methylase UbiE
MISTQERWEERYRVHGDMTVGRINFDESQYMWASKEAAETLCGCFESYEIRGELGLDVGCGIGRMTRALAVACRNVVGIDIVPYAIERAKQLFPRGNFHLFDGQNIPFEDGQFDIVLSWTVLQHVPDGEIKPLASEMMRVLSSGGNLILYENVSRIPDKGHIWFRPISEYRDLFDELMLSHLELKEPENEEGEVHALMVFRK